MKKYIGKLAISCMLLGSVTGCGESFLETASSNDWLDDNIYVDTDACQLVLAGGYEVFTTTTTYNSNSNHLLTSHLIIGDVLGDDTYVETNINNYNRFTSAYGYTIPLTHGDVETGWQTNYKVIDLCNGLIDNLPNLPQSAERDRIEGEARALRAYCYHLIARLYAKPVKRNPQSPGVVLRLTQGIDELPRSTVADAYKQMTEDIEKAITLLDNKPSKYYVTQRAAQAIAARIYLDLGDYANGTKHAKAALEGLTLMTPADYTTKFCTINSETIWNYTNPSGDTKGYNAVPAHWFYATGYTYDKNEDGSDKYDSKTGNSSGKYSGTLVGYSQLRLTQNLVDLFEDGDVRKKQFPKDSKGEWLRYPATVYNKNKDGVVKASIKGGIITTKWKHNGNTRGLGDCPMLRGSEMYLIIAELAADKGEEAEALTALNTLRTARGASEYTGTGADLVNEIQNERRRELFAEGHRLFDLKRRNLPMTRSGLEGHSYGGQKPLDLPAGSDRFEWPIPQREIDANDALTQADQNPAYK